MNWNRLRTWFTEHQGKYVNIIIADQIFGGRSQESLQLVRELEQTVDDFNIHFGTTEVLRVNQPAEVEIGEYGNLIIPTAAEAHFGWHYYGRLQQPENWCELHYVKELNTIDYTESGPCFRKPIRKNFEYSGNKFVELL